MPTFFLNTDSFKASNAFVATLNAAPGATYLAQINAVGLSTAANAMLDAMAATTAAGKATAIAANMGLTGAAATGAESYLTSVTFTGAASTWGAKLLAALDLFTTLQSDATYGAAATSYVARVNSAVQYSSVATNNSTDLSTLALAIGSAGSTGSGSTFTLTTGSDSFNGSGNNDSVSGLIDDASGTLTSSDSLSGGAGTDTLTVRIANVSTGGTSSISPSLSSIEILTFDADETTAKEYATFNTGSVTGITNINSSGSSTGSQMAVTNVAANATIGMTTTRGQLAVDFASTVFVAAADTVTVNLNGAGDTASTGAAATLILDGGYTAGGTAVGTSDNTVDVVTITSATTASRLDLMAGSALKTINVSGDAGLTLTDTNNTFGSVTAVSASSLTGALDITLSSNTRNVTLNTGSGNDRVNLGDVGTNLTADDTLNAGTGTDIAAVSDTSFTAAELTLIQTELTSFETLELTNADFANTANYSFNDISTISSFRFTGTGAGSALTTAMSTAATDSNLLTLTGVENTDSITFVRSITGGAGAQASGSAVTTAFFGGNAVSLAPYVDSGSNSITVTLNGGVTLRGGQGGTLSTGASSTGSTTGTGGAGIYAANFETLNIVSSGTSTNTIFGGTAGVTGAATAVLGNSGAGIVLGTNGTVNVTGTRALVLGEIQGSNITVNAADFTAALTVTGSSTNNTITGGSGADTMDGGAGVDTLTGNGGADVFNFRLGSGTTDSHSNAINQAGAATATADVTGQTASTDSIVDYTKGTDLISITSVASALNVVSDVSLSAALITAKTAATAGSASISSAGIAGFASADDTLIERYLAVANGIEANGSSAGEFAIFEFSGSTYVFVSDASAGLTDGDLVIKLTGVTGVTSVSYSSGDMILS